MTAAHRVVWRQAGAADVEPCDVAPPREGQLLVRTRLSLISPGTERAFFLGLPNAAGGFPQYPGYSVVGEVAAVGTGAQGWSIGRRVACAAHHVSHVVVDAGACVAVPDGASDEEAVFFNLGAIALQGIRKARIEVGEPVAVVGAGLIGLLAGRLARIAGGLPVAALDRDPGRLDRAIKAGMDAGILADEQAAAKLADLCDGLPAVVVEATGNPDAIQLALALAAPMGRVVLLGSTRGETDHVNFYRDVHKKGLTLIGAHAHTVPARDAAPGRWPTHVEQQTVLRLMAARRLTAADLITHRFSWIHAPEAYQRLKEWDLRVLGMVLDWRSDSAPPAVQPPDGTT